MYRYLLYPLAFLYYVVIRLRVFLYDVGLFKTHKFSIPIISVGNIVIGGAGKTPCTLSLLKILKSKGRKPAVVYKGYKGSYTSLYEKVDSTLDVVKYGDEASLVAFKYPDTPVYVAKKRHHAVSAILKNESVDCIILDDAFQHLALKRDLNLLLLDTSEKSHAYSLLPVGRMREPFSAIARADLLIASKTNLQNQNIKGIAKDLIDKCELSFSYNIQGVVEIQNWKQHKFEAQPLSCIKEATFVSGLAKPWQVVDLIQKEEKTIAMKVCKYPDHYDYKQKDIDNIQGDLLITEKDAIKIANLDTHQKRVYVLMSKVEWNQEEESIYEKFNHFLS